MHLLKLLCSNVIVSTFVFSSLSLNIFYPGLYDVLFVLYRCWFSTALEKVILTFKEICHCLLSFRNAIENSLSSLIVHSIDSRHALLLLTTQCITINVSNKLILVLRFIDRVRLKKQKLATWCWSWNCFHHMTWSLLTALALNVEIKSLWGNEEVYYEYHPARLRWHAVNELCIQRSGSLAVVRSSAEKQNLTDFLQSLNISEPVWIARRAPEINGDLQIPHSLIFYIVGIYETSCISSLLLLCRKIPQKTLPKL